MEGIIMDPCAQIGSAIGTLLGLLQGSAIGVIVQLLKRIPVVTKYPKITASVLALAISIIQQVASTHHVPIADVILCVLTKISGAIATYEVAIKPVVKANQP
jgi:hypothetical protein